MARHGKRQTQCATQQRRPVLRFPRRLALLWRNQEPGRSVSQSDSAKSSPTTCDQAQSALFRLPPELREAIWTHAIAGYYVIAATYIDGEVLTRGYRDGAAKKSRKGPLNMLLSCRRIYDEAITLLYSRSLFENPEQRLKFDWIVERRHLRFIRATTIATTFCGADFYQPTWQSDWAVLAELPNLRFLYVSVVYAYRVDESGIRQMLQPLLRVRQCDDFQLTVVWPPGDVVDHVIEVPESAPFELVAVGDSNVEARRPRHLSIHMDPNEAMDRLEAWIERTLPKILL